MRAEARGGDDVGGRVRGGDFGHFEVGGLEPFGAVIETQRVEFGEQRHQPRDRIVGELRVGDVAFAPGDLQPDVDRAAPTDLDGVAEPVDRGWLAHQAGVGFARSTARMWSISASVPKRAGPSSSPVMMKLIVPAASGISRAATTIAATAPFMSTAPRP